MYARLLSLGFSRDNVGGRFFFHPLKEIVMNEFWDWHERMVIEAGRVMEASERIGEQTMFQVNCDLSDAICNLAKLHTEISKHLRTILMGEWK